MRKIDVFTHISPPGYSEGVERLAGNLKDIGKRSRGVPMLHDLDIRFRVMDMFPGYQQVLSLPTPPIELFAQPKEGIELARIANDSMAELVRKHPDRFVGFAAALPMNDPEASLKETHRAVKDLGAKGIQIHSNVLGKPLVAAEFLPLFEAMVGYDLPIWLHPYRGADFPDYLTEQASEYEIWWTFGWPYDTSAAMARIVFAGLFDKWPTLKIIAHHMGAMVPYFAGRVGPGWDQLGARTSDRDLSQVLKGLEEAADRLLQDVLRRHGALRRVRRDGVRAQFLRRAERALRLGCAVRSGKGADVHPRDDRHRRQAAGLE